jgi:hypothetical protein
MAELIYLLCAFTSISCAFLLSRAYLRSHARILLWSALCFAGLSINNVLLVLDKLVFPLVDLSMWRRSAALLGLLALLYGLIFDDE